MEHFILRIDYYVEKIALKIKLDSISNFIYLYFTLPIMSGLFVNELFRKLLSLDKTGPIFAVIILLIAFNTLVKNKRHAFYTYLVLITANLLLLKFYNFNYAFNLASLVFILFFGFRTFLKCLSLNDEARLGSNKWGLGIAGISLIAFNLVTEDYKFNPYQVLIPFSFTSDYFLKLLPMLMGGFILILIAYYYATPQRNKGQKK